MSSIKQIAKEIAREQSFKAAKVTVCHQCGNYPQDDLDLGLIEIYGFCGSCDHKAR